MLLLSNVASASITNLSCNPTYNRVDYSQSGAYNHAWVYVKGVQVGDFWTFSSGSGNYVHPSIKKGVHVLVLWWNPTQGYGQANADCL